MYNPVFSFISMNLEDKEKTWLCVANLYSNGL